MSNIGICFIQSASEIDAEFVPQLAVKTEEIGLHSFWVNDRVTGSNFEPLTVLAAASSVTRNIKLGTSILLPALREPVVLAKTLACLDFLSRGRLIVGIGFGGSQKEFDAVGIPFARRGSRAVEQIELTKRLWREEHVNHEGEFLKTIDLNVGPRPVQIPNPPIWMGGAAEAVLKRIGRMADGYICGTASLKRFVSLWEQIATAAIENGRDPKAIDKAGITYLAIDEKSSSAVAACEAYLEGYYGKVNFDVALEAIVGSPGACVERLNSLFEKGINTVILRLVIPALEQLDLFAEKVLPNLQGPSMRNA